MLTDVGPAPFVRGRTRMPLWQAYEAALGWIAHHHLPCGGVTVSAMEQVSYPEVTGYIVPTVLECGERELAMELARWLVSIQHPDGGFDAPDGQAAPYLFDTAQAMRGLLAVAEFYPPAEAALARATQWMIDHADANGVIRPRECSVWSRHHGTQISEDIHLYTLKPLLEAGERLGNRAAVDTAWRSLDYYTRKPDLVRFRYLTHFFAYVLEALVDLGRGDLAKAGLAEIQDAQDSSGAIPALPGARWVCSPGSLQLAIVGYKLGLRNFANRAMDYMRGLQEKSGGFRGSYGLGATYFPNDEPCWAPKYFLDACHWRMRSGFDAQRQQFEAEPDDADSRIPAVLRALGDICERRVLDVGCGRGQFLRALQRNAHTAELWGVDLSEELLQDLPEGIQRRRASMLNLPFADASFDAVLCVDALEHAVRAHAAIREMCRVLRPGGKLVIVDKSAEFDGLLAMEQWERWFAPEEVSALMSPYCDQVAVERTEVRLARGVVPARVLWQGTRSQASVNGLVPMGGTGRRPRRRRLWKTLRWQRQQRATELAQEGFAYFGAGERGMARTRMLGAMLMDPTMVANHGVVSILAQSVVGRRGFRLIRSLARPVLGGR